MRTDVQHDHGCPEHAWIHYHVSPYVAVTGHGDILDVGCLLACRSLPLIYDHFSYRNVVDPAIMSYLAAPVLNPSQRLNTEQRGDSTNEQATPRAHTSASAYAT